MENALKTNGFVELTEQELMDVNGGVNWGTIASGATIVALGIAVVATAGLATMPIAVIVGAGTVGEMITAGAAIGCGALGGAGMGYGMTHR